jgi:hypothetical protein
MEIKSYGYYDHLKPNGILEHSFDVIDINIANVTSVNVFGRAKPLDYYEVHMTDRSVIIINRADRDNIKKRIE